MMSCNGQAGASARSIARDLGISRGAVVRTLANVQAQREGRAAPASARALTNVSCTMTWYKFFFFDLALLLETASMRRRMVVVFRLQGGKGMELLSRASALAAARKKRGVSHTD